MSLACSASGQAATHYALTVLGQDLPAVDTTSVIPWAINSSGMVAGYANVAGSGTDAFVTDAGGANFRRIMPSTVTTDGFSSPLTAFNYGLSDLGQVMVRSYPAFVPGTAVVQMTNGVWSASTGIVNLSTPALNSSLLELGWTHDFSPVAPGGISRQGWIAGNQRYASPECCDNFQSSALLWKSASAAPTALSVASIPTAIADRAGASFITSGGLVAGWAADSASPNSSMAVVWDVQNNRTSALNLNSEPIDAASFGAYTVTTLTAMRNDGLAVGWYFDSRKTENATQFFAWNSRTGSSQWLPFNLFDPVYGGMETFFDGTGKLIVTLPGAGGMSKVFSWRPEDGTTTLLYDGRFATAYAANASGQVVGMISEPGVSAVLWENGTIVDLNRAVTLPTGWKLSQPFAINDQGQIAGTVITDDKRTLGFILSPDGTTAANPLLPSASTNPGLPNAPAAWSFSTTVAGGVPYYFDPDIAIGYEYQVTAGPGITSVVLPANVGDGNYRLWTWDGQAYVDSGIDLVGGQTYVFGAPVTRFQIRGIETNAALDPADPNAFVTGLTFADAGQVQLLQTPLTVTVGNVPEPGTEWLCLAGGLVVWASVTRRKRSVR